MLKRIIMQDWATIVPIISFFFTTGVFLLVSIRAIALSKDKREALARMPLDENSKY